MNGMSGEERTADEGWKRGGQLENQQEHHQRYGNVNGYVHEVKARRMAVPQPPFGPPPIQWTRKCLSFSSVPHPRWSQKLPLRQRRKGVEGSSIPRSSDEPQWSEGPKCSRRLRVLRFEVDRRLIAQR